MTAKGPRLADRLLAGTALIILSPALALSVAAIRLTDPGPVLYRASRVGVRGETFTMYKLRTMRCGSEHSGARITAGRDPRIFPVGRALRKTRLDETLQLVNVVLGDMALVGPRPEDPEIVDQYYTPTMKESLKARPGLTSPGTLHYLAYEEGIPVGLAGEQYYVRRLLPKKLALDLVYVSQRSLSYDGAVLLRTAFAVFGLRTPFEGQRQRECEDATDVELRILGELTLASTGALRRT